MSKMKLLNHSQISTVQVWEWISTFIPHVTVYVSMLGLGLIHVSKGARYKMGDIL